MRTVRTTVTYLEMLAPPAAAPLPFPEPGLELGRLEAPRAEEYLVLYDGVGRDLTWTARKLMPRQELQEVLAQPLVEVWPLHDRAGPLGYFELDRRIPGQAELAYFGLFARGRGRRLGPWLLDRAIRAAWAPDRGPSPRRVWVHTCTLDDPRALPLYQRAGFVVYGTGQDEVALLD